MVVGLDLLDLERHELLGVKAAMVRGSSELSSVVLVVEVNSSKRGRSECGANSGGGREAGKGGAGELGKHPTGTDDERGAE